MRRYLVLVAAAALALPAVAADPPLVYGVSGAPVGWSDFLARRGPLVLLVWSSWAPESAEVLDRSEELSRAAGERGLQMVLLDVQEPLEDARRALNASRLEWLHDRHGALLKTYRVIAVPSVIIVSPQGEALARLDPSPEAVRDWKPK
ncbi:MAG TPA: thioredoxin-like domain-containing protein [Candidatus Sulfomarinibacteraceae bacterium]|nr:thioredoxin-like domain-containing protein [Candidatus Sulfomarinibacteraceae bacterium]